MAKPLAVRPPSSAVARLFDRDAAGRAAGIGPAPTPAMPETPGHTGVPPTIALSSSATTGEAANIKRELVLTQSADATLTRLVAIYRHATGTKLTTSHVARAMLDSIATCLPFIEREAAAIGQLTLPSNARGREAQRDRFERRIARAFQGGIAAACSPESD